MPSASKKRRAVGETPRLGFSFHATQELSRKILERMQEKKISGPEAEKEIIGELKKKRQK